jgi:molybdate transport system substrate-binding protein
MRRHVYVLVMAIYVLFTMTGFCCAEERLLILCGASFKLPMEEIVESFTKQTGAELNVSYAGVGTLLSQITLSKRGDILIVPSPDIMKKAGNRGHVAQDSVRNMGYFVPSINVQKGNPKGIKCLKDMTRPGIRIALANPESVFVGMLGAEIVDKAFPDQEESCSEKTSSPIRKTSVNLLLFLC